MVQIASRSNATSEVPWAKEAEQVWKKLEKGEYDWAHLAYTIWPERVKETCRKDRSIAIAHGLEDLCEVEAPRTRKRKRTTASGSSKNTGSKGILDDEQD